MVDFAVSILIAEIAAINIEKYNESILKALIPITVLVLLQLLFAYLSLKSNKFRNLVDGKPQFIIKDGKVMYKEMVKQRYNLSDLLLQLREQQITNISDVEYAILEHNGKLSVFEKKTKPDFPLPLIMDGIVLESTLKDINKSRKWLDSILDNNNCLCSEVFYAFYKENEVFLIKR